MRGEPVRHDRERTGRATIDHAHTFSALDAEGPVVRYALHRLRVAREARHHRTPTVDRMEVTYFEVSAPVGSSS